jgi:lipopolysaccharide transport system permease protein
MGEEITILEPTHGWKSLKLKELWAYRDLLIHLVRRDMTSRYMHTFAGFLWIALQPLLTTIIYSIIFGFLVKVPSEGLPYPAFYFAAYVPWLLFSGAVTSVAASLVNNSNLFTKVYFPRLIIPLSNIAIPLMDYLFFLGILLVLTLSYGFLPTLRILALPVFSVIAVMSGLGVGLWFAAFNVYYRDAGIFLNNLLMIWTFATPIFYPSSLVPRRVYTLYALNPMMNVADGFRWALLGSNAPMWGMVVVSLLTAFALLASGLYFVQRTERNFADLV